jgi:sigma-B regulation protein RsbU (phosphoserine phosphatase)
VTKLRALLDLDAVSGMLDLASAAAGGPGIALFDAADALVIGRVTRDVAPAGSSAPVMFDGDRVGTVSTGPGGSREIAVLVARAVELLLDAGRAHAQQIRLAEELAIGRRIQMALVPRRFPDVTGWSFAAEYEAAREVGGDLYDVFPVRGRSGVIALVVADVTGKGIPAALLMADVRALLHAAADHADGPADALARVNRILISERATSLFVTAAMLIVDTTSGKARFASAGHEPPLVARSAGGIEALDRPGPLLGAFAGATFEDGGVRLDPGDSLVMYTDGITETRDSALAFYGEQRLRERLVGVCGQAATEILAELTGDVRAFRGSAEAFDDLTLLVARRDGG